MVRVEGIEKLEAAALVASTARRVFYKRLSKAAKEFGADTEGKSKRDYLSGPRPSRLQPVTGRLRSSVTHAVTERENEIEVAVGTNVKYGKVWELGFQGTQQVRAHLRVVSKVFGETTKATVQSVSSHARKANIKPRPFLSPAIQDMLPSFEQKIADALGAIEVAS